MSRSVVGSVAGLEGKVVSSSIVGSVGRVGVGSVVGSEGMSVSSSVARLVGDSVAGSIDGSVGMLVVCQLYTGCLSAVYRLCSSLELSPSRSFVYRS